MGRWNDLRNRLARATVTVFLVAVAGCDPTDGGDGDSTLSPLEAKVPPEFVTRSARGSGAKLKTPKGWREVPGSDNVALNLQTGRPGSSVNLVVVPTSPGESLNKVVAALPEQLRHEFADFNLLQRDYVIVNDLPAGRLVFEASRGGFRGKLLQLVFVKGGKDYILTYTAALDGFDDELPTIEQVAASLELP